MRANGREFRLLRLRHARPAGYSGAIGAIAYLGCPKRKTVGALGDAKDQGWCEHGRAQCSPQAPTHMCPSDCSTDDQGRNYRSYQRHHEYEPVLYLLWSVAAEPEYPHALYH